MRIQSNSKTKKKELKTKSLSRKKFKHEHSSLDENSRSNSGSEADNSDSSIIFTKEKTCEEQDILYAQLIDTSSMDGIRRPQSESDKVSYRQKINNLWEEAESNMLKLFPNKSFKRLSNDYMDYLVEKFNKLFLKYTYAPWKRTKRQYRNARVKLFDFSYFELTAIFKENTLSELLSIYFELLNYPEVFPKTGSYKTKARRENMYKLFNLLMEEFKRTHKSPPFRENEIPELSL